MKAIHQSWVMPNTQEEPIELHVVTSIGITNIFAVKNKLQSELAINGSIAYLTDGERKIMLRKEIRNIEVSADLAHSQFKQRLKESFLEVGAILNTVVPMLQKGQINSVEIPMSMGLLIASSTAAVEKTFEELIITLSISGDEYVAWQHSKLDSEDDISVLMLGDFNAYDRFRNYYDYDFLQLWGELIQ